MKKILCFGDSNTWGHNPKDCSLLKNRWTVRLKELLPEYDITVDAECGRSTKFVVPDMKDSNGLEIFRERYVNKDSDFDLIIIMLGTNDQLKFFNCPPEETAETLGRYITEYRAVNNAEFLLISPILIRGCVLTHPIFADLYTQSAIDNSKRFKDAIGSEAKVKNAYFLDASEAATASDLDGVHMDEAEHEKLAYSVAKKIKEII